MQSTQSNEFTDVLIDLIGTDDNEDESRPDPVTFSTVHPGINSALVAAQSTARPAAFNRQSDFTSSSESSSQRDRSGLFDFDRIREGLSRPSILKSHSDVSTLSWSRSVGTHGEVSISLGGSIGTQEPELIRVASGQSRPTTASSSIGVGQPALLADPSTKDAPPISLLSPLNLNPPLSDGNLASPPAEEPHVVDHADEPIDPSTLPVWQNIAGLFELMQSQMTSLSRALELARTDSAFLRQRCLDLESQLGIKGAMPSSNSPNHADLSRAPQPQRPDDLRSLTPPHESIPGGPKPTGSDPALTFIRNIDELVWRRSLFSKSPVELAVLASLPDCVRNNDDVLDSRNLAAMEERVRLWESIVRRTQT
ncbi:hypothetical protein V565_119260 [Rhizoctonia solani 123E]|uniref:Uncharacterized protein n=1 Tax=Rhizoctonia solani 123E TaxID=1423351 RepID=A0A074RNK2_9AGAM|nr:hypothetical protein V565_119260 [Rhizoctonia solani 123E]